MSWITTAIVGLITTVSVVAGKGTRDELKREKEKNAKLTAELNNKKFKKHK